MAIELVLLNYLIDLETTLFRAQSDASNSSGGQSSVHSRSISAVRR